MGTSERHSSSRLCQSSSSDPQDLGHPTPCAILDLPSATPWESGQCWRGSGPLSGSTTALGISVNDPRGTYFGAEFEVRFSMSEDGAAYPLAVLLVLAAALLLFTREIDVLRRPTPCALQRGFILFCALFKWQPWQNSASPAADGDGYASGCGGMVRCHAGEDDPCAELPCWPWPAFRIVLANPRKPLLGSESILVDGADAPTLPRFAG